MAIKIQFVPLLKSEAASRFQDKAEIALYSKGSVEFSKQRGIVRTI